MSVRAINSSFNIGRSAEAPEPYELQKMHIRDSLKQRVCSLIDILRTHNLRLPDTIKRIEEELKFNNPQTIDSLEKMERLVEKQIRNECQISGERKILEEPPFLKLPQISRQIQILDNQHRSEQLQKLQQLQKCISQKFSEIGRTLAERSILQQLQILDNSHMSEQLHKLKLLQINIDLKIKRALQINRALQIKTM